MNTNVEDSSTLTNNVEVPEKMGLELKVVSLQNIVPPKNIQIKIEFNGNHLGSSKVFNLKSVDSGIDWEIFFEIADVTENVMDNLTGQPFILFFEQTTDLSAIQNGKNKKKGTSNKKSGSKSPSRKEASVTKETSKTNIKQKSSLSEISGSFPDQSAESFMIEFAESFELLGISNLDVLPLILGKDQFGEVLMVHPASELSGSQTIAMTNLPRLQVLVTGKGNVTRHMFEYVANIFHFTLESLHNSSIKDEDLEVATLYPQNQEFRVTKFTNCSVVSEESTQISNKKWFCLSDLQGQGALSSYKIHDTFLDVSKIMDYEVSDKEIKACPRLQWNQFRRTCLDSETQQIFKDKLIKYRCWPLEILESRESEKMRTESKPKSEKRSQKETSSRVSKSGGEKKSQHYMTFLDLSRLLYPGITSVRLVSQLYTFTEEAMEKNFGSKHEMFEVAKVSSMSSGSKPPKSVASKKEQSQASTPKSKKKEIAAKSEEEVIKEETVLPPEPEPVFNDEGEPVFIVAQVELLRPLVEKKTMEQVLESISAVVPYRRQPSKAEKASINATEAFETCLENLMHAIHEEYQLFHCRNERSHCERPCKNFIMHLHMTGAYTKMLQSMKSPVEDYLRDTIGIPNIERSPTGAIPTEQQNLLTDVYMSLVSKMCDVVNSLSSFEMSEYDPQISNDDLLYFAMEAMEEDDFDKAQEYLLQRIQRSRKADPEHWLDYAKFWVKKQEFEKAGECAREAISLDLKFTSALFFHGLLSWLTEDFEVAEMFLLAVVAFDPFSLEGWVALHMFHKQMNNQVDASSELLNGKKCVTEIKRIYGDRVPPLSWCSEMVESHRIFLLTAIQMIKFSFPELAELALSYDLLIYGRSVNYLYYLAICHYQQGRYNDSLHHLEEASKLKWEEDRIWSLKGHNLYKLQDNDGAKEAYNFVQNTTDVKDYNPFVHFRLGNIFIAERDHKTAQKCYLYVCKVSPSPLSWLGLGIAAFMDNELNDAELALNEANLLDCRRATVWGYLALVNLMMAKPAVYNTCMTQALRFGLDDPVLLGQLGIVSEFVQPAKL